MDRLPPGLPEKWVAQIDVRAPDECWEWTGKRHALGYGQRQRIPGAGGESIAPHRAVLVCKEGHDLEGLVTRHTCDNPPCCNPNHLLPGTMADNMRDRDERGRTGYLIGEASPSAQLTEGDVREILRSYSDGSTTQKELAERFGVTRTAIHFVVTGRNWSHVAGPRHESRSRPPRMRRGARRPSKRRSKANYHLTAEQVVEIREAYAGGASQASLGGQYGLTQAAVSHIVTGKTWADVGGPTREPIAHHRRKLTEYQVAAIRKRRAEGETARELAREFGVDRGTIQSVCRGATYGHVGGPLTGRR